MKWSVYLERPLEDVYQFCLDGENFQKISPNKIEPVPETDEILVKLGHIYPFRQWIGGVPTRWTMHVVEVIPNEKFVDELLQGPMRYVRHTHLFERSGSGTLYTDILEYKPYGGALAQHLFVKAQMHCTFNYRQREMKRLLQNAA